MAIVESATSLRTLADLIDRLGGISPDRIRFHPPPGTATVRDLLRVNDRREALCELVDGVLVEKPMGYAESILALAIGEFLRKFVNQHNLGLVSGERGEMRLFKGLVRIPDVAFAAWDRLPGGKVPDKPVPDLAPNLAVEVLSRGNTAREMNRKREEYFQAGVELVWIVDPRQRTVTVYASPGDARVLRGDDELDGGDVLPGFSLALSELFAELDRTAQE